MRPLQPGRAAFPSTQSATDAVQQQESGGQAGAIGPQTQYGQALGSMQLLPGTARGMAAKLGVDYRPDLMTGTTPQAAQYQRALGDAYYQEGLDKYGNHYDAARYYHGGPNRALWGPKTNAYAQSVVSRMMGQM